MNGRSVLNDEPRQEQTVPFWKMSCNYIRWMCAADLQNATFYAIGANNKKKN